MEKFDISTLTPEILNEIKACKDVEELKALLASKNYSIPDSKLDAILKLCTKSSELDPDELEMVSGGIIPGSMCSCS